MFRDSRGVVHTVSSLDPLEDLPGAASAVLARALLIPVEGDLGSALERCEAVSALIDRWQDAFFAALPDVVDLEEEARWAAEAGLSLADIEAQWEDDDEQEWEEPTDESEAEPAAPDQIDLSELTPLEGEPIGLFEAHGELNLGPLDEDVVAELEVALLLLPLRVRLEALVAAAQLVDSWADLLADHEKALGHLVLAHGAADLLADAAAEQLSHESLADRHASLHRDGPGHGSNPV